MSEIRIPAILFRQKNIELYLFSMRANDLEKLVRSKPKISTEPEGIQRLLDKKRLKSIADYISTPDAALPNNIIVSLHNTVRYESTGGKAGYLVFPDNEGHFGDIIDGQHRLYGVVNESSTQKDIELAVTAVILHKPSLAGKIFADINSNQKPVSKVLLVSLQKELGVLPDVKDSAAAIIERLNDDADSPLKDKLQMFQDETNKWLRVDQAINIITPLLHPSKTLHHLSTDTSVKLLKDYLAAVQKTFPKAWGDRKNYRLSNAAGIEITFGLFESVYSRARELTGSAMVEQKDFEQALEPIYDAEWDAEFFRLNGYTSSAGRTRYRDELLGKLPPIVNKNK